MRIIRTVVYAILVIAGIWLASANTADVDFVYLPFIPFTQFDAPRSMAVPIAFLVLSAVVLGVIIAGAGSLFENMRLRAGVRRQTKRNDKLERELDSVRGDLEQARHQVDEAQSRADAAEEKVRASGRQGVEALLSAGEDDTSESA